MNINPLQINCKNLYSPEFRFVPEKTDKEYLESLPVSNKIINADLALTYLNKSNSIPVSFKAKNPQKTIMIHGKKVQVKVKFTEDQIQRRVKELAKQINKDFGIKKDLTVICTLKGGVPFTTDLVKNLKMPVNVEYITASSYKNESKSLGKVDIDCKNLSDLKSKNVLIIDEIVGTGNTAEELISLVKGHGAKKVRFATFINNIKLREKDVKIDYEGFRVEKTELWFGYGLDFKQFYRNLPFIFSIPKIKKKT